jgi:hypothetical protein
LRPDHHLDHLPKKRLRGAGLGSKDKTVTLVSVRSSRILKMLVKSYSRKSESGRKVSKLMPNSTLSFDKWRVPWTSSQIHSIHSFFFSLANKDPLEILPNKEQKPYSSRTHHTR